MSDNLNVLFITYDGITDPLGQSQILPYLIGLSKEGYRITILSSEKKKNFKVNENKIRELLKKASIEWEFNFYSNSPPLLSTFMSISELKKKAKSIVQKKNISIIHCRSIIPAMIGEFAKKESEAKLIFDIRGFWADERVEGGLWDRSNPIFNSLYKYFKRKEKSLFKTADAIVTLTENAKEFIQANFKTKNKFGVVPCCVDLEHFNYDSIDKGLQSDLKHQLKLTGEEFVLTYVGSLGTRYLIKEMMHFFKKLKKRQKNAKFLFISKHDSNYIYKEAELAGVDKNAILITSCEYSEIPSYISMGNASIFFIVTSFSGKAVSPTKQAEVLSLGLPIVANSGLGDTDRILGETETGIIVSDYTEDSLNDAVEELLTFEKSKKEIRAVAEDYFSLESGIKKYNSLYKNL